MRLLGATVLTPNGPRELDVAIARGRIVDLAERGELGGDGEGIDLRGKWLLPGVIDPHVHFREPGGHAHKGTYASESRAAAAGGVTTVLTMPNTVPPTRDDESLRHAREHAGQSVVNYGFHLFVDAGNVDWLRRRRHAPSYKLYMNETTGIASPLCDEAVLRRVMALGHPLSAHAEGETLDFLLDVHAAHGVGPLYVCHVALAREVAAIREAKARGQWVYGEVTPHHLLLTEADAARLGPYGDMRPTLKSPADQDALWEGIADGTIDTVGSDHAPHLRSEKESPNLPPGVPGVQTLLPLMLDAVMEGRLSPAELVRLTSLHAARIFGLADRGEVRIGAVADLTIVDPSAETVIRNEDQLTLPGWTPFDGRRCQGKVEATLLRGEFVYRHGEVISGIRGAEVPARPVSR